MDSKVKILVGGNAFKHKENSYLDVKGHMFIDTFEDIMKLAQEDNHEATI